MGYQLIETIEVGAGGAASIEFTSIPQDGVDLVLKLSLRMDSTQIYCKVRLNGDTSGPYEKLELNGGGSSVSTFLVTASSRIEPQVANNGQTANTFGSTELYFSNYTSTTDKSISIDGVNENNATAANQMIAAAKYSTSLPITAIQMTGRLIETILAGSTASLYKITA
jgi:hypothetical protein